MSSDSSFEDDIYDNFKGVNTVSGINDDNIYGP